MATLEAVVTELKELNQMSDLEFEATLEVSDNLKILDQTMNNIGAVLTQFLQTVPAAIMSGFDALINFEEQRDKLSKREEEIEQQQTEEGSSAPPKPSTERGFFADNFMKGREKGFGAFGIFNTIKDTIADVVTTLGAISLGITTILKPFGLLFSGLKFLGTSLLKFVVSMGKMLFSVAKELLSVAARAGGALLSGAFSALSKALKVFRVFMLGTFIPGIMSMFSSVIAALTPIVVAAAPFIAIGVAIGAALFGLYKLLEMVTENLGFDSIGETLMYAVYGIKDALFKGVNVFLSMYNGVIGFVKDLINMTPDWLKGKLPTGLTEFANSDMGEMEMLETDSAEKYKIQKQEEAKAAASQTGSSGETASQTGSSGEMSNDDSPSAPTKVKTALEVGGVVVRENGKMRTEFTEEEIQKINAARNAAVAMGNPDPLPNFQASVIPSQPEKVSSKLVYPVVDYEGAVIGAFNTPEEAAQFAMTNSGIVVNAMPADAVRAALTDDTSTELVRNQPPIVSALTPETTLSGEVPSVQNTAPNPSVTVANDRGAMTDVMVAEQSKLDDAKAAESKPSAPVAINAPNTNTTVNNQTINAGPMPSAVDKSDRTDRRGAFRGRRDF